MPEAWEFERRPQAEGHGQWRRRDGAAGWRGYHGGVSVGRVGVLETAEEVIFSDESF